MHDQMVVISQDVAIAIFMAKKRHGWLPCGAGLTPFTVWGYYGWMNSKAMTEGRECNGYLCYRAGLRAGEVAGWACTIAITCSEFHKRHEKSRRLGWVASF